MPLGTQQGGAERLLTHLLRHPGKRFRYHFVFLQPGSLPEEAVRLRYQTTIIRATQLRDFPNYLRTVSKLSQWMRDPDIVVSWMAKAHLYAGVAAFGRKTRTVWYQHGIPPGGWMDRAATMLPADRILCCSRTAMLAQSKIFPHHSVSVCYPGASVVSPVRNAGDLLQLRRRLGLALDGKIVGMIARLERWKGVHVFIEAAKILARLDRTASFFVVGGTHPRDPGYAREVLAQAQTPDLTGRIIMAGQRPAEEIPYWLAAADVMVYPAISPEPFGMAVVEAMSAGRPVVASRCGGPAEILRDGLDGLLVPPGDPTAIAEALLKLIGDHDLGSALSNSAVKRAQKFSIDAFVRRFEDLLCETLDVQGESGVRTTPNRV